jgi:hypothetical protein
MDATLALGPPILALNSDRTYLQPGLLVCWTDLSRSIMPELPP